MLMTVVMVIGVTMIVMVVMSLWRGHLS